MIPELASDVEDLFGRVKQQTTEYHPDMTDDEIKQMISQDAYDE